MTARLRSLLDSATPAPWYVEGNSVCVDGDEHYVVEEVADLHSDVRTPTDADAALIVELRNRAELREDIIDAAEAVCKVISEETVMQLDSTLARYREPDAV